MSWQDIINVQSNVLERRKSQYIRNVTCFHSCGVHRKFPTYQKTNIAQGICKSQMGSILSFPERNKILSCQNSKARNIHETKEKADNRIESL